MNTLHRPSGRTLMVVLTLGIMVLATGAATAETLIVNAGRIDTGTGEIIENGTIIVADGIIAAVGHADQIRTSGLPADTRTINLPAGVVTPGLIDANATVTRERMGLDYAARPRQPHGNVSAERPHWTFPLLGFPLEDDAPVRQCPMAHRHVAQQHCPFCGFPDKEFAPPGTAVGTPVWGSSGEAVSEVVPETRVIDSVDLRAPDFARLARSGVTTVFVSPGSSAVIGARAAIVKTAGPVEGRIVRTADAIKASMGRDPIARGGYNRRPSARYVSTRTRRPTTRMGVAWVLRKALFDARDAKAGLGPIGGADAPRPESIGSLNGLLDGDIPLRIHARNQMDILTAIRLTDEFGLRFTLDGATEAYRCTEALRTRDIPVVYGPIFVEPAGLLAYSDDSIKPRLGVARALLDAGIRVALSAGEMRDEEGLAAQAREATRCGLSYAEALAAVTSQPASILGIDSEVGVLAVGKNADMVLWDGQPLAATTPIAAVVIGGEIVHERK